MFFPLYFAFFFFFFLYIYFFFEFCCLLLFLIKHFATIFGVHLALRRFRSPWRLRSTRRWLLAGNILRLSICVDVWCISWSLAERRHQAISCISSHYHIMYVCTRVCANKAFYVFVYNIYNCELLSAMQVEINCAAVPHCPVHGIRSVSSPSFGHIHIYCGSQW